MFSSRLSLELNKGPTKMERSPGAGQCKFKPQLHNAAHSPERLRLKISTSTPTAGDCGEGRTILVQGHECRATSAIGEVALELGKAKKAAVPDSGVAGWGRG